MAERKEEEMRQKEVLERAFAMPLTNPAYPPGPYRFVNREYLIITYRADAAKLRAVVPDPLEFSEREPLVKYEFIRMPDSNGFGDYTESGQVIPVSFRGRHGGDTHCMFLNDEGLIAGGRELWGFPKKLAQIEFKSEKDMVYGTLERPAGVRLASAIVRPERPASNGHSSAPPAVSFRLIPSAEENGRPVCADIIETHTEVKVHEAWTGTGSIAFAEGSRLDPWNRLPVKRVIQASYVLSEMTLGFGKVIDRLE